jgi:uroporphyrin-III C-methyltransferase
VHEKAVPTIGRNVNEPVSQTEGLKAAPAPGRSIVWPLALTVAIVLGAVAAGMAYSARERLKALELELVRRQEASHEQANEARTLAKQAQDESRDAVARVAVIEARVAESTLQRSQIEDLIVSLSRSRDENVLADTEAAVRVAMQQAAITGSSEPLVAALRQTDERLARVNEPRLELVRRAVARDLDRVRAAGAVDISSLTTRLDEVTRMVDELPMLASAVPADAPQRSDARVGEPPARSKRAAGGAASSASAPAAGGASAVAASTAAAAAAAEPPSSAASSVDIAGWVRAIGQTWSSAASHVWNETRALVRVSRVDTPDAALLAPEQAFFVRENLKLRLLNARLALLSRQFDLAQADLRESQAMLDRYFDRGSRRVAAGADLLRQAAAQVRNVTIPKPDDTLAAMTAAAAGR